MKKSTPKSDLAPKTSASADAVFEFCDRLAAQGLSPTYEQVSRHFSASNDTIGPHIRAWHESRPSATQWEMSEATKVSLDEAQSLMWGAVCRLAQSKLFAETHDLKRDLRQAQAQVGACEEVIENLKNSLAAEKDRANQAAEDALDLANELHEAKQRIHETEAAEKELSALRMQMQALEQELQKAVIQAAKLEGQIEGMRTERENK